MQIKLTIALLLILLSFSVMAQDKSNIMDKKYTLESCVNQFDSENLIETKGGSQYWFVDKQFLDGRTVKMSMVAPHSFNHPPHSHAEDEIYFILEGSAQFILNSDTVIVKPYTSLYSPPESLHGIMNAGDTELKYLVIKKYAVNKK